MTIWIVVVVFVALLALYVIWSNKQFIKIEYPTAGFLNLKDAEGAELVQEDRGAVVGMFHAISESETSAPSCDVLFLYADVQADGSVHGTDRSLRELIADSGAKIVLVATNNDDRHYSAALKKEGARANIVLTLDRLGTKFPSFIERLFQEMRKGLSMPVVWARLVPQKPDAFHEDAPNTIFLAELGQVRFPYSR